MRLKAPASQVQLTDLEPLECRRVPSNGPEYAIVKDLWGNAL